MTRLTKVTGAGVSLLLVAGLAACAPQQQAAPPATAPAPSSTATTAPASMDHPELMAHCAEMRQQARQGVPVSADMRRMLTSCEHMDHSMGSQRGRSGPY